MSWTESTQETKNWSMEATTTIDISSVKDVFQDWSDSQIYSGAVYIEIDFSRPVKIKGKQYARPFVVRSLCMDAVSSKEINVDEANGNKSFTAEFTGIGNPLMI